LPSRTRRVPGVFISLEGGEGSGKTTQAVRLCRSLTERGYNVLPTREPGGTLIAERLRSILLEKSVEPMASETETLIILAARRQHTDQVIRPALARGTLVICDRFSDSTLVYQGYARGLDLKILRTMNDWATGGLTPHLTVLFDIPVATGLTRRRSEAVSQNRLDLETERFHTKVRAGFLALAKREPRRIRMIDARQSPDTIARQVETLVLNQLGSLRVKPRRHR
jgi:dTMP kinase